MICLLVLQPLSDAWRRHVGVLDAAKMSLGPCTRPPPDPLRSIETAPGCAPTTPGGRRNCQSAYDQANGYVLACYMPDGCGEGQIPCWCVNPVSVQ